MKQHTVTKLRWQAALASLVAVSALFASSSTAQAWYRYPMLPANYGYGMYSQELIPYFAAFPPVYYSHPQSYPYGRNVYTQSSFPAVRVERESHGTSQRASVPQPLRIKNPYVK